jgi:hypothetical protein
MDKKFGEYAVAATAFFVSISSLCIYIYQSKLMTEQQHVSAWPYLEWYTHNIENYRISAQNKGVGPAIVRKVDMSIDDRTITNNAALIDAVLGPNSGVKWQNSDLEGRVLSPGEVVPMLTIPDRAEGIRFEEKLQTKKFVLKITYCSVYGHCWTSTGFTATRGEDDKLNLY